MQPKSDVSFKHHTSRELGRRNSDSAVGQQRLEDPRLTFVIVGADGVGKTTFIS
jgi:GTPase SAR1 family protein